MASISLLSNSWANCPKESSVQVKGGIGAQAAATLANHFMDNFPMDE